MFVSPAFAQASSSAIDDFIKSSILLLVLIGIAVVASIIFKGRQINEEKRREGVERLEQDILSQRLVVREYRGNQTTATALFQADAVKMAAHGLFPTLQSWAPGQWGAGYFIVAILLIPGGGIGILMLAYLLIVKPDGTLSVTYERRATGRHS